MKRWFALTAGIASAFGLAAVARADVDFVKDVKPLLEANCVKCHGPADKPKAGLRLDTKIDLVKGSKNGKVVEPGKAAESKLYEAITKPKDEDGHMPPKGDGLTKAQIELVRDWINQGVKWPDGLVLKSTAPAETKAPEIIIKADPGLPISDAEKAAVAKLQQAGVLTMRLAQNTNWLRVDFRLRGHEVKEAELVLLKDIPNLVELDLGGTTITDSSLIHVRPLTNLTRLQLHNTKVSDAGLENLKGLTKLVSLNLYGTAVTDKGVDQLKGLKGLKAVYLWQTKVTEGGAKQLASAVPGLNVDRGYEPPPPPKPEEKKADAKPADAKTDAKPAEKKDAKPADVKTEKKDAKPDEKKPEKKDAKPDEKKPEEKKPEKKDDKKVEEKKENK
jgi:mono/diheme cytochrome c family protein